jgi:hypothetical protein
LGNSAHIFVVAGLRSELLERLRTELYREQVARSLPTDCRLIPYDALLAAFEETFPPRVTVLVPGTLGELADTATPWVAQSALDQGAIDA